MCQTFCEDLANNCCVFRQVSDAWRAAEPAVRTLRGARWTPTLRRSSFLTSGLEALASRATKLWVNKVHVGTKELHRLRNTEFTALFVNVQPFVFSFSGAVSYGCISFCFCAFNGLTA